MALLIAAAVLAGCLLASWAILRRPFRRMVEDVRIEHARGLFHRNRERLEARFVSALERSDPSESELWETAHWHDDILWARDRQTNHLLALTFVEFEPEPFELSSEQRHATAIFEFHNGHWCAQGKHVDELRPTKPSTFSEDSRPFSAVQGSAGFRLTGRPAMRRFGHVWSCEPTCRALHHP